MDDVVRKTGDTLCPVCSTNRDWVVVHFAGLSAVTSADEAVSRMFPASVIGLACTSCGFLRLHLHKQP
jgi:hypothetical protein